MLQGITVTDEEAGAPEPEATITVRVAQPDFGGITAPRTVAPRVEVIAVEYGEHPASGYEHSGSHNVQIAHIADASNDSLMQSLAHHTD